MLFTTHAHSHFQVVASPPPCWHPHMILLYLILHYQMSPWQSHILMNWLSILIRLEPDNIWIDVYACTSTLYGLSPVVNSCCEWCCGEHILSVSCGCDSDHCSLISSFFTSSLLSAPVVDGCREWCAGEVPILSVSCGADSDRCSLISSFFESSLLSPVVNGCHEWCADGVPILSVSCGSDSDRCHLKLISSFFASSLSAPAVSCFPISRGVQHLYLFLSEAHC